MSREALLSLVNNAALLMALVLLYESLPLRQRTTSTLRQVLTGSLIGGIAVAIMLNPWRFAHGVIFDTRSVLLSISGLYFGFLPTLSAALIASAFRYYLGGIGTFTGIGSILLTASLGLLWRFSLQKAKRTPQWYELYAFGWIVHLALLVWFFTLPAGMAFPVLRAIFLPVLFIYPFATVLIGLLFNHYDARQKIEQALVENEALFSTTFHTNPALMAITRLRDGIILNVNKSFCQTFNLQPEELIGHTLLENRSKIEIQELDQLVHEIQNKGQLENFPIHIRLPNGNVRQFLYSTVPVTIQDESCLINVGTDITELQEKQSALERRLKELQVLNDVGLATVNATDENELIARVTSILSTELYREQCGVILIDSATRQLQYHPSYYFNQPHLATSISPENGVFTQAIQTGQPILIADSQQNGHREETNSSTLSKLVVPLHVGDEVLGVFNVESDQPNFLTEDDQRLLKTVADQLASAIERLRAQKRAAEQRHIAEALAATAIALNANLELETVFRRLVSNVRRVIACDAANITLLEGNQTHVVYLEGYETFGDAEWVRNSRLNLSATPNYQEMIRTKAPVLIPDTRRSSLWRVFKEASWIASYLSAPICVEGKVIGFLNLDHSQANFFNSNHAQILSAFAEQAALAIRNARLFEDLRRRLNELEAINRVSLALRAAHSPQELLPLLLDETLSVLETSSGAIWLFDDDRQHLKRVVARGWMAENPLWETKCTLSSTGNVPRQGEALPLDGFISDHELKRKLIGQAPPRWQDVCLPIASVTEILGFFCVALPPNRGITQQDQNILSTLAEIAAIALQRSKLLVDLQHQADRLASLRRIDHAISTNTDFYPMAETILEETKNHLGVDVVQIWTLDSHLPRLIFAAGIGLRQAIPSKSSFAVGEGLAGKVALSIQPLMINDLRQWLSENPCQGCEGYLEEGIIAYYGIPLLIKGKLGGVIELCQRDQLSTFTLNDPQWTSFAQTIASQTALAIENAELLRSLNNTLMELSISYDETLKGWAKALELRDRETYGHSERVTEWTLKVALALGVEKEQLIHIRRGTLLHDIGKIGVPDTILLKEGPLTPEEWEIIRQHPIYAYELLHNIPFLKPALDIPYCHHEKWDGSGYPRGLKGEEIPLAARIFAVVDVWDALTSDRPYRKAWSPAQAKDYLRSQAGKHFDPHIVEVFLKILEEEETHSSPKTASA
ncbi:MAG: hypothetical protein Kow0088_12900 [Anaerolineales bacterium]